MSFPNPVMIQCGNRPDVSSSSFLDLEISNRTQARASRKDLEGTRMAIVYLLAGVPAPGDDGDTADLEELHLVRRAVVAGW